MRRLALLSAVLMLAATLTACAGSSSTVHRTDYFSGMTFSMPIGSTFK